MAPLEPLPNIGDRAAGGSRERATEGTRRVAFDAASARVAVAATWDDVSSAHVPGPVTATFLGSRAIEERESPPVSASERAREPVLGSRLSLIVRARLRQTKRYGAFGS